MELMIELVANGIVNLRPVEGDEDTPALLLIEDGLVIRHDWRPSVIVR
jgi:hypothetical protein